MDANVDTVSLHDPDAVVLALPLLLLLLRPNASEPRSEAKPLLSSTQKVVASRTITSLDGDRKMNAHVYTD